MHPANEWQRYNVTLYLIGWAHTQKIPAFVVICLHSFYPYPSFTLTKGLLYDFLCTNKTTIKNKG